MFLIAVCYVTQDLFCHVLDSFLIDVIVLNESGEAVNAGNLPPISILLLSFPSRTFRLHDRRQILVFRCICAHNPPIFPAVRRLSTMSTAKIISLSGEELPMFSFDGLIANIPICQMLISESGLKPLKNCCREYSQTFTILE